MSWHPNSADENDILGALQRALKLDEGFTVSHTFTDKDDKEEKEHECTVDVMPSEYIETNVRDVFYELERAGYELISTRELAELRRCAEVLTCKAPPLLKPKLKRSQAPR